MLSNDGDCGDDDFANVARLTFKHTWHRCKKLSSRNFAERCQPSQILPMPTNATNPSFGACFQPNRETETALSRVPSHFPHRGRRRRPGGGAIMASRFLFSLPSPTSAATAAARVDPPSSDDSKRGRESRVFSAVKERNGGTFLGVWQWQKKEEVASFRMVFQLRRLTLPA